MKESSLRSLVKTLSWRVIASGTTLVISYAVTGAWMLSGAITGIEFFLKPVMYFIHERIWQQVSWHSERESTLRSGIKTATWRILAFITMFFIAYFVTGDEMKAVTIGGTEVIIKTILYFFHERGWATVQWGRKD